MKFSSSVTPEILTHIRNVNTELMKNIAEHPSTLSFDLPPIWLLNKGSSEISELADNDGISIHSTVSAWYIE
jgi:hypothetical protein